MAMTDIKRFQRKMERLHARKAAIDNEKLDTLRGLVYRHFRVYEPSKHSDDRRDEITLRAERALGWAVNDIMNGNTTVEQVMDAFRKEG